MSNNEARMLKCKGEKCKCSVQRKGWEETNQTNEPTKRILGIDLPAIFKWDFLSIWFLTFCNWLMLCAVKAGVWTFLLVPRWVFELLGVSENLVCSVAFTLTRRYLGSGEKTCSFTSGKCVRRVPLCGDTANVILFTDGLREHLFEGNGGIPDFSPGFAMCLVKEKDQDFWDLCFAYIFFFLPSSLW